MGIAVDQVLDVAEGGELREAGTDEPIAGLRLLRERVTGMLEFDVLGQRLTAAEHVAIRDTGIAIAVDTGEAFESVIEQAELHEMALAGAER